MAAVTKDGFAKPFDANGQSYPMFGSQIPALRSFYFGYGIGGSGTTGHEVSLIQVLAGGESQDLSPSADLNPANIEDGRLDVILQDENPANERVYFKVSHSLLNIPGIRRFQFRSVGCVGQCDQKLPIPVPRFEFFPPIIGLVGFKLFFTGGRDHKLDRIGVWFRGSDLHVAMRDRNGGDTFGYLVDFVVIPTAFVNVVSGIRRGNTVGGERISIPGPSNTDFLLTGWAFNFVSGDHKIREIGVVREEEDVTVFYGDENVNESFDWRLEWAHVGPREVSLPADRPLNRPISQDITR